jgi:GT2 family glycosyltransferase
MNRKQNLKPPPNMLNKLSVIINHCQTPELLRKCLESVKTNLQKTDYELIVTDSLAQNQTAALVKKITPAAVYLPFSKNVGFGRSVNEAIKKSNGEYLLILNADTALCDKNTVPKMIDCLQTNPDIGLLGPRLINSDGSVQESAFRFYDIPTLICRRTVLGQTAFGKKILAKFTLKDILTPANLAKNRPISVGWLMGSVLLVRRSALAKVGLLDERFFMYFEDVDWARRFRENGFGAAYLPDVRVLHRHSRASRVSGGIKDFFLSPYARIHFSSAIKYLLKYAFKKTPCVPVCY